MNLTAARYSIMVDGQELASFSELQGIRTEVKGPIRNQTDFEFLQQAATSRSGPLTFALSRPRTHDARIWSWHEAVHIGQLPARKNGSIVVYDSGGKLIARYAFQNAWPSKLQVGGLKAGSSEVLMETVTFVCERIQRVA